MVKVNIISSWITAPFKNSFKYLLAIFYDQSLRTFNLLNARKQTLNYFFVQPKMKNFVFDNITNYLCFAIIVNFLCTV